MSRNRVEPFCEALERELGVVQLTSHLLQLPYTATLAAPALIADSPAIPLELVSSPTATRLDVKITCQETQRPDCPVVIGQIIAFVCGAGWVVRHWSESDLTFVIPSTEPLLDIHGEDLDVLLPAIFRLLDNYGSGVQRDERLIELEGVKTSIRLLRESGEAPTLSLTLDESRYKIEDFVPLLEVIPAINNRRRITRVQCEGTHRLIFTLEP